jgi:hypothetical protein
VTVGPIIATTTGINVIIAVTTAGMIDVTTIIATIATTGEATERVIAAMTSAETIGVMIDVARMTTTAATTTARSALHHHHLTGATIMVFQLANREINFIVGGRQATKSNRQL